MKTSTCISSAPVMPAVCISNLKHNGFRWSPRFSAWQRQLTDNAFYAVTRVVPVVIEQLRKGGYK